MQPFKDFQIFQAITFERWALVKKLNILFERCFTLTHTQGDLVFVSISTWSVILVAAHKGESLAVPILQVAFSPAS